MQYVANKLCGVLETAIPVKLEEFESIPCPAMRAEESSFSSFVVEAESIGSATNRARPVYVAEKFPVDSSVLKNLRPPVERELGCVFHDHLLLWLMSPTGPSQELLVCTGMLGWTPSGPVGWVNTLRPVGRLLGGCSFLPEQVGRMCHSNFAFGSLGLDRRDALLPRRNQWPGLWHTSCHSFPCE